MKKLLVLMMALAMTLSLAACGGNAEPPASTPESTPAAAERKDNVTPEQAAATANGWDQDEEAVQELNAVYATMDSARVGLGELDGYGDTSTEGIDEVVAMYQAMLDEMPNIIAKYSEPYSN